MIKDIIFIFVCIIIFLVILLDALPKIKDWLQRIYFGRIRDRNEWKKSITNIGEKWINNTPKIMMTDNTRLIVIDIMKGKYFRKEIQYWQEASLILGLSLKKNINKELAASVQQYLDSKFDEQGNWKIKPMVIDSAILAYSIMKIEYIDVNKYRKAFDYTWSLIKNHIGEDGTVGYRKTMMLYRYVDTIGFICPFLIAYGKKYNKQECINLAINQIRAYENYGVLQQYHLPVHAYKLQNFEPVGLYGWGRGMGWYALGLIDSWNELTKEDVEKQFLEDSIVRLAKSAIGYQQNDGSWRWTITRDESRADSSTTAILAWFMVNASKISELKVDCTESFNKAINYLMSVTRRNGAVDFSQGDTKDIGVYSMHFNTMPFTQGLCIRVVNLLK